MALIPNLSAIPDLKLAEGGREYDLRITTAKAIDSKKTGREGVLLVCSFVDEENVQNMMHQIWFGNTEKYTDDDEEKSTDMWRRVKEFVRALGFNPDQDLEVEDFKNLEFTAIIDVNDGTETDEEGNVKQAYNPKNEITRIVG